jgi:Uma2 family endonuclease
MTMLAPAPLPSIAAPTPATQSVPPPVGPAGHRVLLPHISWATYQALLTDVGDGATRLTYDNGWLEIEMLGRLHEQTSEFASEMVTAVLKRLRVTYEPSGSTTCQRSDLLRGLQADKSYHIQSVGLVAGKVEWDLTIDPPPDVAIEVEVESPLLDKVPVYAGLGVPELWRVRADGSCDMFGLDGAGAYQPITASVAVPPFTPAVVSQYLRLRAELGHSAAIARFEAEFLPTVSA